MALIYEETVINGSMASPKSDLHIPTTWNHHVDQAVQTDLSKFFLPSSIKVVSSGVSFSICPASPPLIPHPQWEVSVNKPLKTTSL